LEEGVAERGRRECGVEEMREGEEVEEEEEEGRGGGGERLPLSWISFLRSSQTWRRFPPIPESM